LRVVVAPCSPFSVTPDLMRQSAALARSLGVRLHTHLAETLDEEQFCLEKFGHRPAAYMETLDWVGDDVWYAHSVHVNDAEIAMYARTGCGVAHCPSSNMRLASGIAPVTKYRAAGVKLGLGVDGSASNDGSHLLGEARQAMLLARVLGDPGALTARQALELCWAATTSARWRRASAPTSLLSTSAGWPMPAPCTTPWPRCCSAPRKTWTTPWCTAGCWCAPGSSRPSISGRWWSGTTS
jgi:cytosine/adenosine deaminase-related metal-dependent hydrolase